MAREQSMSFSIAGEQVKVDLELLTCESRDSLEDKVIEVRKRQSIYFKYPLEENETNEKWSERVSKIVEEEYARQDGESVDSHLKRMFNSQDSRHVVRDILNAVSETFCAKTFTDEQLKKTNPIKLKRFLYDVLTQCDIPAGDLKPAPLGK